MHFRKVEWQEIDQSIAELLDIARREAYYVVQPETLATSIKDGEVDVWELVTAWDAKCILVTTFQIVEYHKFMDVLYFAGKNCVPIAEEITKAVLELAEAWHCAETHFRSKRPGIAFLSGAEELTRIFRLRRKDGIAKDSDG